MSSIEQALSNLPSIDQPDIYLDLSKGILIKNEGLLYDLEGTKPYLQFDTPAIGLARLLISLSTITGNLILRDIKWEQYLD